MCESVPFMTTWEQVNVSKTSMMVSNKKILWKNPSMFLVEAKNEQ